MTGPQDEIMNALARLNTASQQIELAKQSIMRATGAPTPSPGPTKPIAFRSAAVEQGWGEPNPRWSDDFLVNGAPDPAKWQLPGAEGWPGHNQNGRRLAEMSTVRDGYLLMSADVRGNAAWIRSRESRKYARLETRVRTMDVGGQGDLYHLLALIGWPTDPGRWPQDGEYDTMEIFSAVGPGVGGFYHYPHDEGEIQQESWKLPKLDPREWHTYSLDWNAKGLVGWVDGEVAFRGAGGANRTRRNLQDASAMGFGYQIDNFSRKGPWRACAMQVDYHRSYAAAA